MADPWDRYKEILRQLWIVENKQLVEVARIMERDHGFRKSPKTYETRFRNWGVDFKKKKNSTDWNALGRKIQKRKMEGKGSTVLWNGKALTEEKLRREISRHGSLLDLQKWRREPSPQTPEGLTICTPLAPSDMSHILFNLPFIKFQPGIIQLLKTSPMRGAISNNSLQTLHEAKHLDELQAILPAPIAADLSLGSEDLPTKVLSDVVYAISNGFKDTSDPIYEGLLDLVERNANTTFLLALIRTRTRTGRAFLQKILEAALWRKRPTIFHALHDAGLIFDVWAHEPGRAVLLAVQHQAYEVAKSLLRTNVNVQGPAVSDALRLAAAKTDTELVLVLIQAGAEINSDLHRTWRKSTPLENACQAGRRDIVELLIEYGADVRYNSSYLVSPLMAATLSGDVDMAIFLIERGALLEYASPLPVLHYRSGALELAAKTGHKEIVQVLLDAGAYINPPCPARLSDRWTALAIAIRNKNVNMVKLLLDRGASPNSMSGLLCKAVENNSTQIVQLLISAHVNLNERSITPVGTSAFKPTKTFHETALHKAIMKSNPAIVCILIAAGAIFNLRHTRYSGDGSTSIRTESNMDLVEGYTKVEAKGDISRLLLAADPSLATHSGLSLLYIAVDAGDIELAQLSVNGGADINEHPANAFKGTALQYAIRRAQYDIAAYFMESGAHINAPAWGYKSRTALQSAVWNGNKDWVLHLTNAGADVNAPAGYGDRDHIPPKDCGTALRLAAMKEDKEILGLLLNAGASVMNNPLRTSYLVQTALQGAAEQGNLEITDILIRAGADIDAGLNDWRGTALQAAARNGHIEVVNHLLHERASINAVCDVGTYGSPLQEAASTGFIDVVHRLLECDADPNIPGPVLDRYEETWCLGTPLFSAMSAGSADIARLLVDHGARADILSGNHLNRRTALEAAMQCGEIDLVKCALEAGANPNLLGRFNPMDESRLALHQFYLYYKIFKMKKDFPPIICAIAYQAVEIVQLLLDYGADVNIPFEYPTDDDDVYKLFPLEVAVANSNMQITLLLLRWGADATITRSIDYGYSGDSGSLVSLAIRASSPETGLELVRTLITAGASIDPTSESKGYGTTALQAAAESGNVELVELLLQHNADVNEPPPVHYGGDTALQLAALCGFVRTAFILLEAGADPNADGAGPHRRTALEWAAGMGRVDIVQMLLNACNERAVPKQRYARALKYALRAKNDVIVDMIKTEMGDTQINLNRDYSDWDSDGDSDCG